MVISDISLLVLSFSFKDALLVDMSLALFTHLVFNRIEPLAIPVLSILLVAIPAIPSLILLSHLSLIASLGLSFGAYYATLLSSIAFYRLSPFHPLSRYPGPTLLKLSTLWVYKTSVAGRRHLNIQKLHEQYNSDVVRIGPNELSFRDVSSIAQIMGTQGLARGPAYDGLAAHAADRAILTWRDATIHAKRRIPWIHGFNAAALKEYEPALNERVVQLVDGLLQRHGTVDVMESIKFFSYDFMGDMAFNGVSELMRDGDTHGQMQVVQTCIDSTIMRETMPWLTRYISDGADPLRAAAAVMGMQRVQKAISRRDLFYYLNNDDGAEAVSPPLSVVIAEAALVIIAGSDTTSGTLCNILYSLVRHPDVYKELQEEVDKFYPLGENALDSAFHSKMTFLEAVINETLRLYPVVPSGSQRFTSEGVTISSCYVPRNTSVRSHTWSIHRDPRNFSPFTNEFWPERWLIAEKSSSYQSEKPFIHNLNAYIPFSFGPANCVGKHLALKEIRTVLCYLLQQVSLRFAEGFDPDTWDSHLKDNLTLEVGHLPVVVTARGVSKP